MEVGPCPVCLLELLSVNAGENSEAEGFTLNNSPGVTPCLLSAPKTALWG